MRIVIEVDRNNEPVVNASYPASVAPVSDAPVSDAPVSDAPVLNPTQRILVALADEKYTYRSIEALTLASGLSTGDTREILENNLPARRNTEAKESYTIKYSADS